MWLYDCHGCNYPLVGRELAFNKPTDQSSRLGNLYAYKAVDGSINETSVDPRCFSTRYWGEEKAWLSIDLGTPYAIQLIIFHGYSEYQGKKIPHIIPYQHNN